MDKVRERLSKDIVFKARQENRIEGTKKVEGVQVYNIFFIFHEMVTVLKPLRLNH